MDINDVESFEAMMRDCDTNRGVIVSSAGFTDGAFRRAQQSITITVLSLDDALKLDWALESCLGECRPELTGKRGLVLWDSPMTPDLPGGAAYVFRVGKCDGCHQFHVWCFECGRKFIA